MSLERQHPADAEQALEAIGPLTETYRLAEREPPAVEFIAAEALPEPYRRLLAHENDMTPTLEAFHGQSLTLNVIYRRLSDDELLRQVVLVGEESGRKVEFGAIRIFLNRFGAEARRRIEECHLPLGSILAHFAIPHTDRPSAFFRVTADERICRALGTTGESALYGRCNTIYDAEMAPLACIVEILPPAGGNGNRAT